MADEAEHEATHEVEELLDWLTGRATLLHIKLAIDRSGGKKRPVGGERQNLYRVGKDAECAGETVNGHPLLGIEDHPGDFTGVPTTQRNYAVFPGRWPIGGQDLLVLDGDFGPEKTFKTREALRNGLPEEWFAQLPYTETDHGFHFYVILRDLPTGCPRTKNKCFKSPLDKIGEVFGGNDKTWVWEKKARDLHNWDVDVGIPVLSFDFLKPQVSSQFYPASAPPKRAPSPSLRRTKGQTPRPDAAPYEGTYVEEDLEDVDPVATRNNKQHRELIYLMPVEDTERDDWLMIGMALHFACDGSMDTFHLALWIEWCQGGPEDEDLRKSLRLPRGPPVPWSATEHQRDPCVKQWVSLGKYEGPMKTFGSVNYWLKHNQPDRYKAYTQCCLRDEGDGIFHDDLYASDDSVMKFSDKHLAMLAKNVLPNVRKQSKMKKVEEQIYVLDEKAGAELTGLWVSDSNDSLKQIIVGPVAEALAAAKKHYFALMYEIEDKETTDYKKLETMKTLYSKAQSYCEGNTGINNVFNLLKIHPQVAGNDVVLQFFKAQDKMADKALTRCLWPFNNGIYDLHKPRAVAFGPADPADCLFYTCGYKYDVKLQTDARKEVLLHLLSVAGGTMPDGKTKVVKLEERMRFVLLKLLVLAAAMRPDNYFQSIYFLRGSGGNSKGASVKMFQQVFGNQEGNVDNGLYRQLDSNMVTKRGKGKAGAASPDLANLIQSRLVGITEPDPDETLDLGAVKAWTGEDTMSVRGLYADTMSVKPKFTVLVECNKVPPASTTDGGWRRRYREFLYGNCFDG